MKVEGAIYNMHDKMEKFQSKRTKKRAREPFVPVERHQTVRQKIISLLENNTLSAKDISVDAGVSEREIYEHLEHIRKTAGKGRFQLIIAPATCKKCGFVFRKRERLKKPGRCPVCRSELIDEPFFSIKEA